MFLSMLLPVRVFLARALLLVLSVALAIVLPIAVTFPVPAPATAQSAGPELPRLWVDTTLVTPTGITIPVGAGGDLQAALATARPGDVIELQAGVTFTGNFTLPNKVGMGWIYIKSSAAASLPPGTRVTPAQAALMPKIVSPNTSPAIRSDFGAHHYRFIGIEITTAFATTVGTNYGVVFLGYPATSLSQLPTDIIFDRCYIHGTPTGNVRRGILLNAVRAAVIDSYLSDFHEVGADSQAIAGWNGFGPFKIVNNYLEGAGENVIFGGADPSIPNLVPSDIEVRTNHFFKPVAWRGSAWQVKNLFELKNAQRVLVDGNIFEYNWPAAQNGFSILFTPRNQDGTAPWSVVQDVTFTHNIVRHVGQGMNLLGRDDIRTSQQMTRVLIKDNLFVDVGGTWGNGILFQILNDTADVTIDHNTGFQTDMIIAADTVANTGFVYRNNITPHNLYGVKGSGVAPGLPTLNRNFPGYVFARNILAGGDPAIYPTDNFFPATMANVGFVDLAGGNYRLAVTSPYVNAGTDGRNLGADIDAVEAATAGAVTGGPPAAGPTVAITSPAAGVTVAGTITVAASASDSVGVAGVQFRLDGVTLGSEITAAPYALLWKTSTVANGSHTLTAVARNAAGITTTSAAVTVNVNNGLETLPPQMVAVPRVSVTAPTAGVTVAGTITVAASASDSVRVAGVQFRVDGVNLGAEVTAPPYTISWNTASTGNGVHTLTAVARNAAGIRATSAGVTVTVNNPLWGVQPPPMIMSVNSSPTCSGAAISWTTNTPTDAQVEYGLNSSYGSVTPLETTLGTAHSVTLSGLAASTPYHFRVNSRDATGVLAMSNDSMFTTTACAIDPIVPVTWTNLVNATVTGSSLRKSAGCNGCRDAGANSWQQIVSGDGYVEFTVNNTTVQYVVSLGYGGMTGFIRNYAIHLNGEASAEVREQNWTYQAGIHVAVRDILRIAVVNGRVRYMKNGVVFYTSASAPTGLYPLRASASLWSLSAAVQNAMISGTLSTVTASSADPLAPMVGAPNPDLAGRSNRSAILARSRVERDAVYRVLGESGRRRSPPTAALMVSRSAPRSLPPATCL